MDQSELIEREYALEGESLELGAQRYRKDRPMPWREETATSKGESDMPPGKKLLKESLESTTAAIEVFMAAARAGKAGRKHSAIKYLENVEPMQAAYITARVAINASSRKEKMQKVAMTIASYIEDHLNLTLMDDEAPGLYHVISEQVKKSTSERHKMLTFNRAMDKAKLSRLQWNSTERVMLGSKLLELFIEATGLVETVRETTARKRTVYVVKPTQACADWLEKEHARCELLAPVYLPMLVQPKPWSNPWNGGYLSRNIRLRLVKTGNRAFLTELANVDMPQVYSAINAAQETPWRINTRVLDVLRVVWEEGGNMGGLPAREDAAVPAMPCASEDVESFKATHPEKWNAWKRSAATVYQSNAYLCSKRLAVSQKLWIAERFKNEDAFYFPHQLDFRGRLYPVVPFVNPQGDDSGKAMLEFAQGMPLGEDGPYWLAVHIANLFGVDKVSFDERVAWVQQNESALLDSALNPLDGKRFWTTADSPYCALAACFDWLGYSVNGAEHVSHMPVALDGSCSGLQHYSAMLRDPIGGLAVNLVPSDKPNDIYSQVARRAQELVDKSSEPNSWCGGKVTRKIAKQPTMTYCYASTRYGMQRMIHSALKKMDEDNLAVGKPLHLGGADNYDAAAWLSHIILQSIGETVVAAQSAMDWLKAAARIAASAKLPVHWTTPVGLLVLQEYRTPTVQKHKVHFGGARITLALASEGRRLDKKAQSNGIAPNVVHSLDAAHLMKTVNKSRENGIHHLALVHDSFGTHAGNITLLGVLLREAFIEQYTPDVLAKFRDELVQQLPEDLAAELPPLPEKGDLDLAAVADAQFCFA